MKILIKNCTIIPMTGRDDLLTGSLALDNDRIVAVGDIESNWQPDRVINASGMLAMPGLINAHTHASMTLLRSYADDLPLMQWLSEKIWPLEDKLAGEDVYWGAMLCCLELIKSGTTTFADMYFYMDDVARAVEISGMRACLSRGMIGNGPTAQLALDQSREFIQKWQGAADGRITTMLGPHAPYTCPPDYLAKVVALAGEFQVGIHMHLAETRDEIATIRQDYGKTPIEYARDAGLFNFPTLAAHCVHVTAADIAILQQYRVGVAHNPESNMKLASGIAPVPEMLQAGIPVALGTDGAASNNNLDLLEEMRSCALLHKVNTMDPMTLPSYQALEMATVNGARALGLNDVGRLKPGYKADLILVNLERPHLYPRHDLYAHLVYAAQSSDIETVIINGQVVMENRRVLTINEAEILRQAQDRADRLVAPKGQK